MDSVIKKLEKYKSYIDEGQVYMPATEKGRKKLGIEIPEIPKHTLESSPALIPLLFLI